jgi:deoxyinosine 3'endonuclease (endonuclease V)
MEAYQVALVAVAALLVGALLPVLFQLLLTLKAVRAMVAQAGPAVASIVATSERLERLTAKLEEDGRVDRALEAVDSLSATVGKLQETARLASTIGAAVIPAVAAAVQAWRARDEDAPAEESP